MSIITEKVTTVKVFFSNGVNAVKPWNVGVMEGHAICANLGYFTEVETAIIHAVEMARIMKAELIVPMWLQTLADDIAENDWRYADCRDNDSIGQDESQRAWEY